MVEKGQLQSPFHGRTEAKMVRISLSEALQVHQRLEMAQRIHLTVQTVSLRAANTVGFTLPDFHPFSQLWSHPVCTSSLAAIRGACQG